VYFDVRCKTPQTGNEVCCCVSPINIRLWLCCVFFNLKITICAQKRRQICVIVITPSLRLLDPCHVPQYQPPSRPIPGVLRHSVKLTFNPTDSARIRIHSATLVECGQSKCSFPATSSPVDEIASTRALQNHWMAPGNDYEAGRADYHCEWYRYMTFDSPVSHNIY
jgi:hypothetical protein